MSDVALDFGGAEPPRSAGIQIAPLIDIVFLLIGFFMLATQLIQTQADPAVQLPEMTRSKAGPDVPAEITVNVRTDGSLLVNGRTLAARDLAALLSLERGRKPSTDAPLRVVIRADKRQHFDKLDKVLEACRNAGISSIILRAERGAGV